MPLHNVDSPCRLQAPFPLLPSRFLCVSKVTQKCTEYTFLHYQTLRVSQPSHKNVAYSFRMGTSVTNSACILGYLPSKHVMACSYHYNKDSKYEYVHIFFLFTRRFADSEIPLLDHTVIENAFPSMHTSNSSWEIAMLCVLKIKIGGEFCPERKQMFASLKTQVWALIMILERT